MIAGSFSKHPTLQQLCSTRNSPPKACGRSIAPYGTRIDQRRTPAASYAASSHRFWAHRQHEFHPPSPHGGLPVLQQVLQRAARHGGAQLLAHGHQADAQHRGALVAGLPGGCLLHLIHKELQDFTADAMQKTRAAPRGSGGGPSGQSPHSTWATKSFSNI